MLEEGMLVLGAVRAVGAVELGLLAALVPPVLAEGRLVAVHLAAVFTAVSLA